MSDQCSCFRTLPSFCFPFYLRNDKNVTSRDTRKTATRAQSTTAKLCVFRRLRHAAHCFSSQNCKRPPIRIKWKASNDSAQLVICDRASSRRAENSVSGFLFASISRNCSVQPKCRCKVCRSFHWRFRERSATTLICLSSPSRYISQLDRMELQRIKGKSIRVSGKQ